MLKPLPMQEALDYWDSKVQLSPKQFYALADQYKVRAFTVSKLARADMMGEIFQSIRKVIENGTSFDAWKKAYQPLWEENGWTGKSAWRVDNIFRTNVQTAYNVGRYKQMMDVADARPYWQYSAVNDSRTRPTHRALHGRVYRADSPFWDTFYPPNGFRCRCKVTTLSGRQVKMLGLEVREGNGLGELIEPIGLNGPEPARQLMPDKGFEGNPGKEFWQPDLSKYPDVLRQKLETMNPLVDETTGRAVYVSKKTTSEALDWARTHYADTVELAGMTLDAINEINAAANETLVRLGLRLDRLGMSPPSGAYGFALKDAAGDVTVDISAPFAKNATSRVEKDHANFLLVQAEHVRAARGGLAQAKPGTPIASTIQSNLQEWEAPTRWSVLETSSRPVFSAMAHECGHVVDFVSNKVARDVFSRELVGNGVTRVDELLVSKYGASKRQELFAEVFALWAEGRSREVPKGILDAFETAMETVTRWM